jgi:penicillin-binding protein 1B
VSPDTIRERLKQVARRLRESARQLRPHLFTLRTALLACAIVIGGIALLLTQLWKTVDQRLAAGVFSDTMNVYAAPRRITKGLQTSAQDIASFLARGGYSEKAENPAGSYRVEGASIEIMPGSHSYTGEEPCRVAFRDGKISEILGTRTGAKKDSYLLEPPLLANFATDSRERRRLVRVEELPPHLVNALLSAEDKNFFSHTGFDSFRVLKAAFVNLRSGRKEQGGSTLTMQLARNLWLDPEKTWRRKANEFIITLGLEAKLSKQQILEHYANQVYLGRRETFDLHGFGEASRAYFNKEVHDLTLPEAALLAGIIQRPSYFDPQRHPEVALARRNTVLGLMQRNGFITAAQQAEAVAAPLSLSQRELDAEGAPYFVALARDEWQSKGGQKGKANAGIRIYTTVDLDLQRAAAQAVTAGMAEVDRRLSDRKTGGVPPQVALAALDPHTGEVKAVVGGRDYGASQLNRALAKRQPGSVFKPFVYAAALGAPLGKPPKTFTIATILQDEPTQFKYGDETYEPANYGDIYFGPVGFRVAIAKSLNNATVSLAEQVGYSRVADIAKLAGLEGVRATPSLALGSYETSPLDIAGAYTVFANDGEYVSPLFVREVQANDGKLLFRGAPVRRKVLDPRVNWLMVDILEDVVRSGTAADARSKGVTFDAAGKTGTSHDGWFAGFSSGLLCVVWVGYDDNRELPLEGARSALVVWTEFMKRAVRLGPYAKPFPEPPKGISSVPVDSLTGLLPGPNCPDTVKPEWFLEGTEPKTECTPPVLLDASAGGSAGQGQAGIAQAVAARGAPNGDSPPPDANAETGHATHFTSELDGRLTANGERTNSKDLTAAHARLPLGSRARVTNLATGHSIVVRINDRCRPSPTRVINLSMRAAEELDLLHSANNGVRVEPLEP